jgi:phosphatidylglycerol:prolipoprotein diacylglycerol transferase
MAVRAGAVHPILWTLSLTPETAQIAGFAATILLSIFIVYDGYKTHGRAKLAATVAQAVAFLLLGVIVSAKLLTRERLPDPVVLDIRYWGVFAIIGMCSCFLIQRRLGKEIGVSGEQILTLWVYGGLAAVFGARALHVAVNWASFEKNPLSAIAFWDGGMVYIGGVTCALAVGLACVRRFKLGLRAFDVLAVGVAATQGLGRVGCFLAGCCYGRETGLPWAVRFSEGSIALFEMRQTGQIPPLAAITPPLHPTQIYEAIVCFALGALLYLWYRRGPKPGTIVAAYFILYSSVRFLLELLRYDPDRRFLVRIPEADPILLSTSQTAGLVLILLASVFLWRLRRAEALPTAEARASEGTLKASSG